jgi:hypothetical protein
VSAFTLKMRHAGLSNLGPSGCCQRPCCEAVPTPPTFCMDLEDAIRAQVGPCIILTACS